MHPLTNKYSILCEINIIMFQEQPQKGLFTFYWEETHSERKHHHHTHRSQLIEPVQLAAEEDVGRMEEKKQRKKHHKTEKHGQAMERHRSDLLFPLEKDGKNVLVPHTITLVPGVTQRKPKIAREQHGVKYLKEKTRAKASEQEKKAEGEGENALEKLLFSEESPEYHKMTLEIDQNQLPAKPACNSTVRPAKLRKATLRDQTDERHPSYDKFPSINVNRNDSHQPHTPRFPQLFSLKRSKKLRGANENCLLEKICLEKGMQESNSVVNIGMGSVDDYKVRWKKRKAEFLALLSQSVERRALE